MFITPDFIAAEHQYRRERLLAAYPLRVRRHRRRDRARLVEEDSSRRRRGGSAPIEAPTAPLRS